MLKLWTSKRKARISQLREEIHAEYDKLVKQYKPLREEGLRVRGYQIKEAFGEYHVYKILGDLVYMPRAPRDDYLYDRKDHERALEHYKSWSPEIVKGPRFDRIAKVDTLKEAQAYVKCLVDPHIEYYTANPPLQEVSAETLGIVEASEK